MAHPYSHLYQWSEHSLAMADIFREKLEAAGFTETRWSKEGRFYDPRNHFQFFRQDTELTALFVNLEPSKEGIVVRYGLDSTSFTRMKGDEESLLNYGICSDDACLRWEVHVTTAEDPAAAAQIAAHFRQYQGKEKAELLNISKELRKVFLNKFTEALKPLGFRKKGNAWRKVLPGGHTLCFTVDKSSYGDGYDFVINLLYPPQEPKPDDWCLFTTYCLPCERLANPFFGKLDWQICSDGDIREILDIFLKSYHDPLLSGNTASQGTPLYCQRKACLVENCPLRSFLQ